MIHHNRVAIDIDGVLANYLKGITEFSGKLSTDTCTRYDMIEPSLFDSREDFLEHHTAFVQSGGFRRLELLDDTAPEATRYLKESGCEIFIVTARCGVAGYSENSVEQDTRKWLHDHGIIFDKLILSTDKTKVDAEYIIDDSPFNIINAIDSKKPIQPYVWKQLYNTYGCEDLFDYQGSFEYVSTMIEFAEEILKDMSGEEEQIRFKNNDPLFGEIIDPNDKFSAINWLEKIKLKTAHI